MVSASIAFGILGGLVKRYQKPVLRKLGKMDRVTAKSGTEPDGMSVEMKQP